MNITELTAKLKAAAQDEIMCREACDTSDLWQDEASPENVLALLEALEKAQRHENEWKELCNAAALDLDDWEKIDDKSRELVCKLTDALIRQKAISEDWERKAISNFEECAKMSQRIAELEARTLTVKLPKTFFYEHDDLSSDVAVLDKRLVKKSLREACAAAGIKLQIEGE